MKKLVLAGLSLACLSAPAVAQTANFGFAVQADNGLKLTITAYNKKDEQIFKETVSRREVQDGKRYYILRIDEDIILENQPIKTICVEDPSGTWSILPVGGTVACDTSPVDTRGTYFFAARTFPDASSLAVDSGVKAIRCVQDELNALGFNAGAADGVLGNKTRGAGEQYVAFMKGKDASFVMPGITADNAKLWCQTVAEQHPSVARFWEALK